jgi:hypothetical protein
VTGALRQRTSVGLPSVLTELPEITVQATTTASCPTQQTGGSGRFDDLLTANVHATNARESPNNDTDAFITPASSAKCQLRHKKRVVDDPTVVLVLLTTTVVTGISDHSQQQSRE